MSKLLDMQTRHVKECVDIIAAKIKRDLETGENK